MDESYVVINSNLLKKACEFGLARINEMRQLEVEENIDHLMSKRFFRPKSREAALERLKEGSSGLNFSAYEWIMLGEGFREGLCKDLKGMAELMYVVNLSRSDYNAIKGFINKVR